MAETKKSAKICAENNLANIQRSLAPFIIILFMRAYVFYFLFLSLSLPLPLLLSLLLSLSACICLNIMAQNYGAAFYKSAQIKLHSHIDYNM